eukprot:12348086-Heterocapsa_arctica.AAC.1
MLDKPFSVGHSGQRSNTWASIAQGASVELGCVATIPHTHTCRRDRNLEQMPRGDLNGKRRCS